MRDFVATASPALPLLPLVRILPVSELIEIFTTGKIAAADRKIYKTKLCYFFYGKPAYQVEGHGNQRFVNNAAACIILKTAKMPKPTHVFPFDTGAYQDKRYASYLPRKHKIEDFELEPNLLSAQRLVTLFYENNHKYFRGQPSPSVTPSVLDYASQSYRDISRSEISTDFDERCSTCEFSFDADISVDRHSIEGIVLPDQAWDDANVKHQCQSVWNIKPIIYPLVRSTVGARTFVIYTRVGDYYLKRKYL